MCVTAILAGVALVASAAGAYTSIQSANAQRDQSLYVERMRRKQLSEQSAVTRLAAGQQEIERGRQYQAERSAALAAIGASGLGDHISFFQGIEPSSRSALADDVRAIRLNLVHEESQIADSIAVSEYSSKLAKFNAGMSKVGAIANFAGDVVDTFSFYQQYKRPKAAGA